MRESEVSNNKLRASISVRASGPRAVSRSIGLEYNAIVSLTVWLIGKRLCWSASNKNRCCIFFGSGPAVSPRPRRTKPGGQERGSRETE